MMRFLVASMRSITVMVLCVLLFTGCSSLIIHDDDNIAVVATKVTVRTVNCALTIFFLCASEWGSMEDAKRADLVWYGTGDINGDNYKCQQEASSSSSGAPGYIHMPMGNNVISMPMDSGGGTKINEQLHYSCMRARGYTQHYRYDLNKWLEKQANSPRTDGSKYVGESKDGFPNGQGTYTFPNGDIYAGEFKDRKQNGLGTFTHTDGRKYVGEFKNGFPNGQGTNTFPDGGKYVGEFKNGFSNGQGTYTFTDGGKYVGEFKNGKYHGQGTFTFPNGQKRVGEWRDNVWQK